MTKQGVAVSDALAKEPSPTPDKKISWSEKTTGEKAYEIVNFLFGKVFIIAITAVLAFKIHPEHAPDKIGPFPNYLKKFQSRFHDKLLHNSVFPMAKRPFTKRFADIFAAAALLCHGGNAFAPLLHGLENGKDSISMFFNRHFGKKGELEIAHERLKDEPKQSWGDTIKGRAWSLLAGFTAATGLDALINKFAGKHKPTGKYYFDAYEEKFGRWLAGFSKEGKEIAATPITQPLKKETGMYRFGKVIALDLYITSATLALWIMLSRLYAKTRKEKKEHPAHGHPPADVTVAAAEPVQSRFSTTIQPLERGVSKPQDSHVDRLSGRHSPENAVGIGAG
jgi:hypothetical protein